MAGKREIEAGRAVVKAYLDDSAIGRGLKRLRGSFDSFASTLSGIGAKAFAGGLFTGGLFAAPLKRAAEMETVAASFKTLTGSAEAASKVMADLRKLGAETPFEFPELADAARSLLAFGVSQDALIPTMRRVGDVASAVGMPFGELAEIYGKAKVQGRLFQEDINQLTGRGIPVIQELAKQFGVSEDKVRKLVETGQVNFGNLERAFVALTSAGGKFAGMMDAQSRTLAGRWSTLKDTLWEAVTPLGEALLPYAGKLVTIAAAAAAEVGGWTKANGALAVKVAASAAAAAALGAAAMAAAAGIRTATYVAGAFGTAIRFVLMPATAASVAFRTLAAVMTGVLTVGARTAAAAVGLVSLAFRSVAAVALAVAGATRAAGASFAAASGLLGAFAAAAKVARFALVFTGHALTALKVSTAAVYTAIRAAIVATTAFGIASRVAAYAMAASSAVVRAAGAAFAAFGVVVNGVAAAVSGVGIALAIFGNPVGGIVLAVGLLAAGIALAYSNLDSLKGLLGRAAAAFAPVMTAAKAAFGAIWDAMNRGDMKTAAAVLWASLEYAWAAGTSALLSKWLDFKAAVLKGWLDLDGSLRTTWTGLVEWLVTSLANGIAFALNMAATAMHGIAHKLGRFGGAEFGERGAALGAAANAVAAAGKAAPSVAFGLAGKTDELNAGVRAELAADEDRRKNAAEGAAEAEEKFAEAIDDARRAARDAAAEQEAAGAAAAPDAGTIVAQEAEAKRKRNGRDGESLNSAAVVGTQDAADALAAAMMRQADPAVKATQRVESAVDRAAERIVTAIEAPKPAATFSSVEDRAAEVARREAAKAAGLDATAERNRAAIEARRNPDFDALERRREIARQAAADRDAAMRTGLGNRQAEYRAEQAANRARLGLSPAAAPETKEGNSRLAAIERTLDEIRRDRLVVREGGR